MISRRACSRFVAIQAGYLMVMSSNLTVIGKALGQTGNRSVLQVGPTRAIKTIAQASILASAGAIIEVDSGEYRSDVAVWTQEQLTLRAAGGRVKLIAAGASAEAKAIWVVRGGQMSVEGFDFTGARVPNQNGAGIRFEKGLLRVRDCTFMDNEIGILTSNQKDAELEIENSEFGHNGYGHFVIHNSRHNSTQEKVEGNRWAGQRLNLKR